MRTANIKNFLQLQFCLLLLFLTLMPELSFSSFDFIPFICKLLAVAGGGMALYYFYQQAQGEGKSLEMPFLASAAAGLLVGILSLIPSVPSWLDYVGLVALAAALFLSQKSLGIEWKNLGAKGVYLILLGVLLHIYDGIGDTMCTHIAALVGLALYWVGLGMLKDSLDQAGQNGAGKLKIAVILGIVATIIGFIPLLGFIVAGIVAIIAFIFEFLGYGLLKNSESIKAEGQAGAGKLRTSMIIMLVASIVGFIPLLGIAEKILCIIALYLVLTGWNMVLLGIESEE